MSAPERPDCLHDDHLVFLNSLRDGGTINMMGAAVHLRNEYGLDRKESQEVLMYWMRTV